MTKFVPAILLSLFLWVACNDADRKISSAVTSSAEEKESQPATLASPLPLLPLSYVKWVQDASNGLKREKTIDEITFSILYKPLEYIVCLEERKSEIFDSVLLRKTAELEGMQYVDYKIKVDGFQGELLKYDLQSPQQYEERVRYYSFEMQKDLKLVQGKDTLDCGLFHFERGYDAAPYCTFTLGFPKGDNPSDNRTIIFHDKIFQKGIIKIELEGKRIAATPKLITSI